MYDAFLHKKNTFIQEIKVGIQPLFSVKPAFEYVYIKKDSINL